jgi:hypothetical protein
MRKKHIVAVIGDSTFLHMGMQGLLNMIYNRGNVTVLLLDNRSVGMTGGQENPGTGLDLHGLPAPRVDFAKLAEALASVPNASAWWIPTSCRPWSSWCGKRLKWRSPRSSSPTALARSPIVSSLPTL